MSENIRSDGKSRCWEQFFDDKEPPEPRRKRRSKRKDLEASVVRECLAFLRACKQVVYVERRNTGAVSFEDGGYLRFGSPGAADIWCLITYELGCGAYGDEPSHHHIEIECKRRSGGRLSKSQQIFQDFCNKAGIPYFVVTSAENLAEQLADLLH